jgi:flagellar hook assembly protein FlgD
MRRESHAVTLNDLRWDGVFLESSVEIDGAPAPDGRYVYQIVAFYGDRAIGRTQPLTIVLDREPPAIKGVRVDHTIIASDEAEAAGVARITQTASSAARWTARIVDTDGNTVRSFSWSGTPPRSLIWDGRSDAGGRVAEGTYRYILTGTDRAGNRAAGEPVTLVLGGRVGAVRMSASTAIISPDGDGFLDFAVLTPVVPRRDTVASWTLRVSEAGGRRPEFERTGISGPPAELLIGGSAPNGDPLPDGDYLAVLSVRYDDGHAAASGAVPLTIDTIPPSGIVSARAVPDSGRSRDVLVFGGEGREAVAISATLSPDARWTAIVRTPSDTYEVPLAELKLSSREPAFRWDGRDAAGRSMPDGEYSLMLRATDPAGNIGTTNEILLVKDTRDPTASIRLSREAFSPNGDGNRDSVTISAVCEPTDMIDEACLSIRAQGGGAIVTECRNDPFHAFDWDGRSESGSVLPDGVYSVRLLVAYRNGDRVRTRAHRVRLDTTAPHATLSVPYRLLSPNGDGYRDAVAVDQSSSDEQEWVGRIVADAGDVVFERRWKGQLERFVWDGTGRDGRPVADGGYTYRVIAVDSAGNVGESEVTLVVDKASLPASRQAPELSLSVAPVPFTPDGDGRADRLTARIAATSPNELANWQLEISRVFGPPLRTMTGEGSPPATLVWDGRLATGERVLSASDYLATLTVRDVYGNEARAFARVRVGIMTLHDGLHPRVVVPSVTFAPGDSDIMAAPGDVATRNLETLRTLAEVLRRYPDREILIAGHATHLVPDEAQDEGAEGDRLVALSAARAEAVRDVLVILGVDRDRISTVAVGGARPIVPEDDRDHAWRNERVELILGTR